MNRDSILINSNSCRGGGGGDSFFLWFPIENACMTFNLLGGVTCASENIPYIFTVYFPMHIV